MTTTTPSLSLGEMLAHAREERGISLEKAAHDTKIRAAQLREMEKDNTFYFSHPSYARLFLRDYAKYLDISYSKISEFLPDAGECSSMGMEYLQDYSKVEKSGMVIRTISAARSATPLSLLTAVAAIILLAVLGLYGWRTHKAEKSVDVAPKIESKAIAARNSSDRAADKNFLNAAPVGEENAVPVSNEKSVVPVSAPEMAKPIETSLPQKAPENAKVGAPLALVQPPAQTSSSGKSQ